MCTTNVGGEKCTRTASFPENLKGRDPLRTPIPMPEDNIKMHLELIGREYVDWLHVAENIKWLALVNTTLSFLVP
jgi:hypothetical protein